MAKFMVLAEVVTVVRVAVEAPDAQAAHGIVAGMGSTAVLAGGNRATTVGMISASPWHRFDREKVKNCIPRLSDEDADAIVALADSALRVGASGAFPDAASYAETDEWSAVDGAAISALNARLGLDGNEIEDIYGEAFSYGLEAVEAAREASQ